VASVPDQSWLLWNDPQWRAAATAWGEQTLREFGRPVVGPIEQPHVRAWSTAFTLPTAEGTVWLKAPIPNLAHEVATLELLAPLNAVMPRFVAGDRERGWMLIEDAGQRLREVEPPPLERWEETVSRYAALQLDAVGRVDELLAGGVPDRRGSLLAEELDDLLHDDEALKPPTGAALSDEEIERLRAAVAQIEADTAELERLGVPNSIHHDDLHDGNVFLDGDTCRIIDWGDACISHPLLTIDLTLRVVEHVFEVDADAPEVRRVRDAYLEPFTAHAPREDLLAAAHARTRVAEACNAVKWYVVFQGIQRESWDDYADAIPAKLRRLLALCA
jgi:Phosphotransferase enzyme family